MIEKVTTVKRGRKAKSDKEAEKLSSAKQRTTEIKNSGYALGKAPENLTDNQKRKLEMIASTNKRLYRGYVLKELEYDQHHDQMIYFS